MPEVPPTLSAKWLRDDGFWNFGGHRFQPTGEGTFRFQSRSNPQHFYFIDIRSAPYCDCWSIRRSPAVPCCHLNTLRAFLKRLKAEQPHTDQ